MSLVADYSDSESENGSDQESTKMQSVKGNPVEIEDEDEWENDRSNSSNVLNPTDGKLFSQLPEPSGSKFNMGEEEVEDEFLRKKPSIEDALYLKEKALLEQEKKEERAKKADNEKPKAEAKRSLLSLPKPKKGNKDKRQPVKISIPTLSEIGIDSDSDDEQTETKQKHDNAPANSKKASALFSLLPKPRHSVTVGANKNKVFEKQTNRVLMPHTLTKKKNEKPNANVPQTKKPVNVTVTSNSKEEESDDDDDMSAQNFFSLGDTKEITTTAKYDVPIKTKDTSMPAAPVTDTKSMVASKPPPITLATDDVKPETKTSTSGKGNAFFANLFKKTDSQPSNIKNENVTTSNKANAKPENNSNIKTVTSSYVTATTIAGPVTKPYGDASNVTRPYGDNSVGNVTKPYGDNSISDVTRPYGSNSYSSVTSPYNNVSRPYRDSNVTRPYGDNSCSAITRPYGDNQPGSSVTSAYNSQQQQSSHYAYPTQPPQQQQEQNFFAYEHQSGISQTGTSQSGADVDYYNQPNQDLPIDREALTALQGRKRRKEEINLIDVKADDLYGNNDDYLKNLSKESGYQSKKPRNKQPSSMDKRKHQITYLAFQAKEREFELRQSWADSRASKQQTQSRYGF